MWIFALDSGSGGLSSQLEPRLEVKGHQKGADTQCQQTRPTNFSKSIIPNITLLYDNRYAPAMSVVVDDSRRSGVSTGRNIKSQAPIYRTSRMCADPNTPLSPLLLQNIVVYCKARRADKLDRRHRRAVELQRPQLVSRTLFDLDTPLVRR